MITHHQCLEKKTVVKVETPVDLGADGEEFEVVSNFSM